MKTQVKAERVDVTLEGLRDVHRRIGAQKLEEGDWPLVGALVLNLIARIERRQDRMLAKIQAAAAQSQPSDETADVQPDCGGHDSTSGVASSGEGLAPPAASACGA